MQHHGVPTRLLDWTENLFVAAHFALVGQTTADDPPTIWCMDPIAWNRATPVLSEYGEHIHVLTTTDDESEPYKPGWNRKRLKSPVAIFGTHNSGRMVAQRGTFTVWGEDVRSLQAFANESNANVWCLKLAGEPDSMRADLNFLGFSETMIYPELTSLASEITRVERWRA